MGDVGNTRLMETGETVLASPPPSDTNINPTNAILYDSTNATKCGYNLTHNSLSTFIAKGTYGMVYRPSYLRGSLENCLFDPQDHPFLIQPQTNYVTKIGITAKMLVEYQEYESLKTLDPAYRFHYPKPVFVDNMSLKLKVPDDCKHYFYGKYKSRALLRNEPYTFLVMNDGGHSLAHYIEHDGFLSDFDNCKRILNSFTQVFHGVKTLIDNRYMHYDMKPQNIVYDRRTGLTKLIDFGLTKNLDTLRGESVHGYNSKTWFNYPIEKFLITDDAWRSLRVVLSGVDADYPSIYDFAKFVFKPDRADRYWYDLFVPYEDYPWHEEMLGQIDNISDFIDDFNVESIFRDDFQRFLLTVKQAVDTDDEDHIQDFYERFLEEYASKLDIFGVGLSLMCMLSPMKECFAEVNLGYIWSGLFSFCLHLVSCNVFHRYDIDMAIEQYEDLMTTMNGAMSTSGGKRRGGRAGVMSMNGDRKLIREKSQGLSGKSNKMNTISPEKSLAEKLVAAPNKADKEKRLLKLLDMDPPEKIRKNQEFDKMYMNKLASIKGGVTSGGGKSKKSKKVNRKSKKVKNKK